MTAVCHFTPIEGGGFSVSKMEVDVHGRVPGVDAEAFQHLAEEGDQGCPVSNALRGNVEIVLHGDARPVTAPPRFDSAPSGCHCCPAIELTRWAGCTIAPGRSLRGGEEKL